MKRSRLYLITRRAVFFSLLSPRLSVRSAEARCVCSSQSGRQRLLDSHSELLSAASSASQSYTLVKMSRKFNYRLSMTKSTGAHRELAEVSKIRF